MEVGPIGFSDVLDVGSERKRRVEGDSKIFVVSNQENVVIKWGKLLVEQAEDVRSSFWDSFEFELYVSYLSGDAEWALGYRSLAFMGEIWAINEILGVVDMWHCI